MRVAAEKNFKVSSGNPLMGLGLFLYIVWCDGYGGNWEVRQREWAEADFWGEGGQGCSEDVEGEGVNWQHLKEDFGYIEQHTTCYSLQSFNLNGHFACDTQAKHCFFIVNPINN